MKIQIIDTTQNGKGNYGHKRFFFYFEMYFSYI